MFNLQQFKEFFNFKKSQKNSYIGIDIGTYSIKLAEVVLNKGKIILTNFIQGKTYPNVIVNGIINDFQYLSTNLKNIFEVFHPNSHQVNLSISYDVVIYDSFQSQYIPSEEEIKKRLNDDIPYNLDDVYYSYFIFPMQNVYKILYLVIKKDIAHQYENLLKGLNFNVNNMDTDFINLHNLVEFLEMGEKAKLIIDWGESKVRLLFSNKDIPVYNRELFNLGLKNLKKEIKKLVPDKDLVEMTMVNPLKFEKFQEVKKVYINYIDEILKEVEYTIDFVQSKFNLSLETIYLVGGGARILDIEKIFTTKLNLETKKLELQERIDIDPNIDPSYLKIINTQGANAVAAALREFI
ncbi:pilus assembly protein PilM [Thermodesulfobacterium sp. TA1]|uniref:pilus assembly protein PilM n=1 Tax=Thermodesulfobacterium sp. TA1 TaxID=2234087 RepID=UPI00143DB167|nr:pilus assembly protein PilM [Thermodesulfobacterium sp. TA1]